MRTITAKAYSTSSDEIFMYLRTTLKPTNSYSVTSAQGETIL